MTILLILGPVGIGLVIGLLSHALLPAIGLWWAAAVGGLAAGCMFAVLCFQIWLCDRLGWGGA